MEPLPVEGPHHVEALLERLVAAEHDPQLRRGLADHLSFVAAVHPDWFRPYQELAVTELPVLFDVTYGDLTTLLAEAPDQCVEILAGRLRTHWNLQDSWMLAAIGTPAALAAVADDVRAGADRRQYEDSGIWVPPTGPAQRRFVTQQWAVWVEPVEQGVDLTTADHPVGLAVADVVADPGNSPVTWHYLSITLGSVPGLPDWPARQVHLVGPRATWFWTLTSRIDTLGRYTDTVVELDDESDPVTEDSLCEQEEHGGGLAQARLKPSDADLVYCNGHVLLTPGVMGTVGGPPIGLYPNPHCPDCGRLMFHIGTVRNQIREYGDGFRSLFLCEDCHVVTSNATGWN